MSRFLTMAPVMMAPVMITMLFLLIVHSAAQEKSSAVDQKQETIDRKAILAELQTIRQRIERLEKKLAGTTEIKISPAIAPAKDPVATPKIKTVEKEGLRIFHEAPIGKLTKQAQIPMGNGHHIIEEIPTQLVGRSYLQRGGYQGNTSFEILKSQTVYVAFYGSDWGGGGNPSGNWLPEIISPEQLREQGWEEFGKLPVSHSNPQYKNEKPWIVFKRKCEKGEKFKLRNHKYQAPVLIWGKIDDM